MIVKIFAVWESGICHRWTETDLHNQQNSARSIRVYVKVFWARLLDIVSIYLHLSTIVKKDKRQKKKQTEFCQPVLHSFLLLCCALVSSIVSKKISLHLSLFGHCIDFYSFVPFQVKPYLIINSTYLSHTNC